MRTLMRVCMVLCSVSIVDAAADPASNVFEVSIDASLHEKWGFEYPVTYIFTLTEDASGVNVFKRVDGIWVQLEEKTSNDFFNGVEAVRFDYSTNKAYVSVGFGNTNNIQFKFENVTPANYDSIAEYYDDREATYTLSNDNWGFNKPIGWRISEAKKLGDDEGAQDGSEWQGMTDDDSDRYQAALHAARMYDLPITMAINTPVQGEREHEKYGYYHDPRPAQTWLNMQSELDNCTKNWGWEPAVHTRTHPMPPPDDEAEWQIVGNRDDILKNLTGIPYGQYIFTYIPSGGRLTSSVLNAAAGDFIFLREWVGGMGDPSSNYYEHWDEQYDMYIGGIQTMSYDNLLQSVTPHGRYDPDLVAELNAAFDVVYNEGKIFYAVWHSDRYRNSVIYSTACPEENPEEASTLMQHFAHVANRKDVWYTANGWLYSYRMVAERAKVAPKGQEGSP